MEDVKACAEEDATSVNQFIVVAVAEKVRSLRERRYFADRAARAQPGDFERLPGKAGIEAPGAGDAVPDGWLDTSERP